MYDEDLDDDYRLCISDYARQNYVGDKKDIQLYEELCLALELMKDDSFKLIGGRINNELDFYITTKYPDGLPINVGTMFFNIDRNYKVSIIELPVVANELLGITEMDFAIKIKRY